MSTLVQDPELYLPVNLRRELSLPNPPPGGSGSGSSGSSGGSSSGSSGSSSSSSSSSSNLSSTSGSSSSFDSSSSSSSTNAVSSRSSVSTGTSPVSSGLSGANMALLTTGIIAGLAILALLLATMMRKRKKAQNRGAPILVVPKHSEDEELATVASSNVEQELDHEPSNGRYKGQDTEFELVFSRTGNIDLDKYWKISGQGFQKTTDNASGFMIMDIKEGFASRDGATASWTEERRPFASTAEQKAMCPKPSCGKGCRSNPGIDGKPSSDDADVGKVQCNGIFHFEQDTFEGQWQSAQGSGTYELSYSAVPSFKSTNDTEEEKEASKQGFVRRMGGKFLNLFRGKKN